MHARWVTRQLAAVGPGEDRVGVWRDDGALVVVLADGAGGIPGGARAADLAVSGLLRLLPGDAAKALQTLDAHIHDDREAGECTAVALSVVAGMVRGASCGDSAAFLDGEELTTEQHRKRRLRVGARATDDLRGAGGVGYWSARTGSPGTCGVRSSRPRWPFRDLTLRRMRWWPQRDSLPAS